MSSKQSVPLKSVQNARELGGYTTAEGRTVKHGVLLRTAALKGISDDDIRLLRDEYRLQHIVDFRMEMELRGFDDPVIEGAEYHHLDVINIAEMLPEGIPVPDMSSFDPVKIAEHAIRSGMIDENMYIGFLMCKTGKKAFGDFFRILLSADPNRAVLWHCTGGKDRTGLAAMLLLSALGVDEKLIVDDYLLTNEYDARRIEGTKQLLKSKGCDDAFIGKALLVFDAVDERFFRNAMTYLKKEFGSVLGYILSELNISQEDVNSLKEKYLI